MAFKTQTLESRSQRSNPAVRRDSRHTLKFIEIQIYVAR